MGGTGIAPINIEGKHVSERANDRILHDLERHGYVVDAYSTGSAQGTLYRHAVAPSLIVHHDGRIELPSGQRATLAVMPQPVGNQIIWRRALLFIALLCAAVFLGLLITALIVE